MFVFVVSCPFYLPHYFIGLDGKVLVSSYERVLLVRIVRLPIKVEEVFGRESKMRRSYVSLELNLYFAGGRLEIKNSEDRHQKKTKKN